VLNTDSFLEVEGMEERQCLRCGLKLPYGSLAYVVNVKVFAAFDGVILESEEETQHPLEELLGQIKDADPKTLEKEVYEEFSVVLCKGCRDRFVEEAKNPWESQFRMTKGSDTLLH
jgi:hypothetical protein